MSSSSSLSSAGASGASGLTSNAPITISGLSSGLDTTSIIQKLTDAEGGAVKIQQSREDGLNTQLQTWQTFNSTLVGLQSIAQSLNSPSAFNTATATIDQATVATVTAQTGATAGNHTLVVNTLANTQKVLATGVADPSLALGITGSFTLNGKIVTVAATDALSDVVANINRASGGVQASIISASTGNYQLSLQSSQSGTINAISAADIGTGTVLESLGLIPATGATQTFRQTITTAKGYVGTGSLVMSSASQAVGANFGIPTGQAAKGTVQIAGTSIALDLNTMTLGDISNAINAAGIPNVQAQIVAIPDASGNIGLNSSKQLQLFSTTTGSPLTAASLTDSGGVLQSLGLVQTGFAKQVSAASDATFTLDGTNFVRSSNSVNDALQSVSINLVTADPTKTGNITIAQDTSSVTTSINNFIKAYNGVNDFINQQFAFTPSDPKQSQGEEQQTQPLFGNFTLTSVQTQLSNLLSASNGSTTLGTIGITTNATGDLVLDSSKLQSAMATNASNVAGLFGTSGSATDPGVKFLSASVKTIASSAAGYQVKITSPATQATLTGGSPFTTLTAPETLSISGSDFGSSVIKLALPTGSTIDSAIAAINTDGTLSQGIFASKDTDGRLVITSKGYGSSHTVTVTSNVAAGGTGIGLGPLSTAGSDVVGTINGEIAIGNGQILTGKTGNATTDGLQLLVTTQTGGNHGVVNISHGVADQLNALVTSLTDPVSGGITTEEASVNSQISDIQDQIKTMQDQLNAYSATLQQTFSDMEQRISTLNNQQKAFAAELGTTVAPSSAASKVGGG